MKRARDTTDKWLWAVSLTKRALKELRRAAYAELLGRHKFTCDTCGLAARCTLAYDEYNIDGDCLYDK